MNFISLGIPYSYTWELPEGDEDGFHDFKLPPKNIIRVGAFWPSRKKFKFHMFIGWKAFSNWVYENGKILEKRTEAMIW